MPGSRFFSGARESNGRSAASEMIRFEMQKKGKLEPGERYKRILKKKLAENQKKLGMKPAGFRLPGSKDTGGRSMSKKAEQALKEMAAKKAAKQAKRDRQMVIVQPKNFSNGSLTKKGVIYDIAGNVVGKVNTKNGKMATNGGWSLGKYKPKNYLTNLAIQGAIDKYSPYYINLRKMQMMQQGNVLDPNAGHDVLNIYGRGPTHGMKSEDMAQAAYGYSKDGLLFGSYGENITGPRQNVGATAWGAASDNVWGTYTDNAWGVSTDNVWGGNSSDVWGGVGGNPFGHFAKTHRVWGTGNGKNYMKSVTSFLIAFLGLKTKGTRAAHEAFVKSRSGSSSRTSVSRSPGGGGGARTTRAPSAPAGRR